MLYAPFTTDFELFLVDDPRRNGRLICQGIHLYVVKSVVPGEIIISSLKNPRRGKNLWKKDKYHRTGKFGQCMDAVEAIAKKHGYTKIRIAGIVNQFLPEVLERRGYHRKPIPSDPLGIDYELKL